MLSLGSHGKLASPAGCRQSALGRHGMDMGKAHLSDSLSTSLPICPICHSPWWTRSCHSPWCTQCSVPGAGSPVGAYSQEDPAPVVALPLSQGVAAYPVAYVTAGGRSRAWKNKVCIEREPQLDHFGGPATHIPSSPLQLVLLLPCLLLQGSKFLI